MRTSGYNWLLWFTRTVARTSMQMVTQCFNQPARSHATVFMLLEGSQRLAGRHAFGFIQSLLRKPPMFC